MLDVCLGAANFLRTPQETCVHSCPANKFDEKTGVGHDVSPGNYIQRTSCYAATRVGKASGTACSGADRHNMDCGILACAPADAVAIRCPRVLPRARLQRHSALTPGLDSDGRCSAV